MSSARTILCCEGISDSDSGTTMWPPMFSGCARLKCTADMTPLSGPSGNVLSGASQVMENMPGPSSPRLRMA